jgi:signal transduction histidine kinase
MPDVMFPVPSARLGRLDGEICVTDEATERSHDSSASDRPTSAAQRGSFLGFVAHEMRNPLSTALWSAELLARLSAQERGGARGEKLSGMCLRALQRLRALVEDHFLSERLDVDGIPIRMENVAVKDAVAVAVGKAGVADLTANVEDRLLVWADRGLLERALDGIIAAAARGKAAVTIEARRNGEVALLGVHGAPPQADALEPPQKGTASDPTGRALALHMALRIARALGGSLSATSDGYVLAIPLGGAASGDGG